MNWPPDCMLERLVPELFCLSIIQLVNVGLYVVQHTFCIKPATFDDYVCVCIYIYIYIYIYVCVCVCVALHRKLF